jgi:hypothetical protein
MKVSELMTLLEELKNTKGDVVLYSVKEDGRSTWVSPIQVSIDIQRYQKQPTKYLISLNAGY